MKMIDIIQKAKPFIKWVGGKGQLLNTIENYLPADFSTWKNATYIEPFVGGGAMLFMMIRKYPNIRKAIINDVNPNLIKCYKTVRNDAKNLIDALLKIQEEYFNITREEERKDYYLSVRTKYNSGGMSDLENTVCFIFLNRTCFNGLYRVNSKGEFNVPFGKYTNPRICDVETILADTALLQRVEIINGDFEDTEKYIQENTLMYFDPPYRPLNATSSFNSYAKEAFGDREQIRLKNYLDRINSRCMLLLSNSDCAGKNSNDLFFDNLYSDYYIERVYASRSVNSNPDKRGKLTELLIRNFAQTQLSIGSKQLELIF